MGSNDGAADERPVRRVELTKGFWIGKYEMTRADWARFDESQPWIDHVRAGEGDSLPVVNISWDAITSFLERLRETDEAFQSARLPTEAEWEYACKSGAPADRAFQADPESLAWASTIDDDLNKLRPHPVGQKMGNAWNIHDMHGNVLEWCEDGYYNYDRNDLVDSRGRTALGMRVARGGSFLNDYWGCRSTNRFGLFPDTRGAYLGFRFCIPVEE